MIMKKFWTFTLLCIFLWAAGLLFVAGPVPTAMGATDGKPPLYTFRVVNVHPHNPAAFTQGLVFFDNVLYEGTGLYRKSSLRQVDVRTGKIIRIRTLPSFYFGEGITVMGNRIYQLTWRSGTGFIYDQSSFRMIGTFTYQTEGWGLTHNGRELIMSDGSSSLYFLDPHTFKEIRHIEVADDRGPVRYLNELEYIDGAIYANIWRKDTVAIISPDNGKVKGWIDLSGILEEEQRRGPDSVLNGIAYDSRKKRLFVTGKMWPWLFEIKVVPK